MSMRETKSESKVGKEMTKVERWRDGRGRRGKKRRGRRE